MSFSSAFILILMYASDSSKHRGNILEANTLRNKFRDSQVKQNWMHFPDPPLIKCVTLDKPPNFPEL